jgi:hypothetical protein
MMSSP